MRRTWVLFVGVGLMASALGCHGSKYTAGACDCYYPPVESLLVAPHPAPGKHVVPTAAAYTGTPFAYPPTPGMQVMPGGPANNAPAGNIGTPSRVQPIPVPAAPERILTPPASTNK